MKIGILTFHHALNNGAVLQAYALQNFLFSQGYEVEIINYRRPIKHSLKNFIAKKPLTAWYKTLDRFNAWSYEVQKKDFGNLLIRGEREYNSLQDLQDNPPEYEVYIAGSDQIWNVGSSDKLNHVYYLEFGKDDVKRLSYAASMGNCNVPRHLNEPILKLLKKFDAISLREVKAVNYIQSLFKESKRIFHTPDPTFLLKEEHYKLLISARSHKRPYVTTYSLAEYGNDQLKAVNYIKKRHGVDVINLRNPDTCIRLSDAKNIIVEPREWLTYMYHANYTICCSFHAVVFSLIFHKSFIVVTPYANERILSLLNSINLSNRIVIKYDESKIESILNETIDWNFVDEIIEKERQKGVDFLKSNL
ncbi:polysaccharide pyruvyl transferase family protein [Zunongwangia sp. SCSIO 43204]|uniref:polysaccharide pyruvyl transferase family protein n=1 Tax=Zunongwangia sp. SCSIO 43204 TaxID=2779359 RepID=UPI001CA9BD23|nr:polysaccharide pyruvyl transferase family protein [Zunongwangia sp. SCSIO 43204]UAB84832.1 polysaccharide pyruvyl transferase family protein [Zunongwangia sp. SCSIO 43204]